MRRFAKGMNEAMSPLRYVSRNGLNTETEFLSCGDSNDKATICSQGNDCDFLHKYTFMFPLRAERLSAVHWDVLCNPVRPRGILHMDTSLPAYTSQTPTIAIHIRLINQLFVEVRCNCKRVQWIREEIDQQKGISLKPSCTRFVFDIWVHSCLKCAFIQVMAMS